MTIRKSKIRPMTMKDLAPHRFFDPRSPSQRVKEENQLGLPPSAMRPFFTYFGSKYNLSRTVYPKPEWGTIVEPFAGSACYSCMHYDRNIILYDKSPAIYGIWKFLLNSRSKEILNLPDLEEGQRPSDIKVCQEARDLISFWSQYAAARPPKTPSGWSMRFKNRFRPMGWSFLVRQRIARQIGHIRHWKVFLSSYENINIQKKATYFVDPPYQNEGTAYACSSRDIEYNHLGYWCKSLCGQVIVCESSAAKWLPFLPLRSIRSTRGGNFSEGIWTNQRG